MRRGQRQAVAILKDHKRSSSNMKYGVAWSRKNIIFQLN